MLFSTLDAISKKLTTLGGGGGGGGGSPLRHGGKQGGGIDIFAEDRNKDNQFRREGLLKEANVEKLSDHEQQR